MPLMCGNCHTTFESTSDGRCLHCHQDISQIGTFKNSDEYLRQQIPHVLQNRKDAGLEGLVGGLDHVVINVESSHFQSSIEELLRYTGLEFQTAFETPEFQIAVLHTARSPYILVQTRKTSFNPFYLYNQHPKSVHLPNTRLETFVFRCENLEKYVACQKIRGYTFLTDQIQDYGDYYFIQTKPSPYIHTSYGFIEWKRGSHSYMPRNAQTLSLTLQKPDFPHLREIHQLDHIATRVKAQERDAAILEFMQYTNYYFDFAIYVKHLNSITNVTRLKPGEAEFAMVFTSGISPYIKAKISGPTEQYIANYGPRVHHMAFHTDHIEEVFDQLYATGMRFLIDLVGSPNEGLKQTFTIQSPHTMIVN